MEIVDMLQRQANEIARAGHYGWGNTMDDAALCISNLQRQLEEKTRLLAAYEAHPVVAWMLTGSNVYEDAAFANQKWADERLASRGAGDKTVKVPLITKPSTTEHLDALIAEAEKRRERRGMEKIGAIIHWPECWDTAAYPTLESALQEISCCQMCADPTSFGVESDWPEKVEAIRAAKDKL